MSDGTPDPDRLGGWLPLVDPAALSAAQQATYDYLASSKLPGADAAGFQAWKGSRLSGLQWVAHRLYGSNGDRRTLLSAAIESMSFVDSPSESHRE